MEYESAERILIVEDDKAIAALLATALELHGMTGILAATGRAALEAVLQKAPAVMIVDLGLPDMEGIDIIRKVRQWSTIPLIVVSARTEPDDKVAALDAGADDYLTKPFSVEEFLARLRAALRRANYERAGGEQSSFFENGPLQLDFAAGTVVVSGQELHLAPMEYKLLCLFARNVGKVLTHKMLLQNIWGSTLPQHVPSLRVFMATLRKKLDSVSPCGLICTHIGIGYRMVRLAEEGTVSSKKEG